MSLGIYCGFGFHLTHYNEQLKYLSKNNDEIESTVLREWAILDKNHEVL